LKRTTQRIEREHRGINAVMQRVAYTMVTAVEKHPPERLKGFIPDEALDRAVEMF
jgi:hypothetical protein